jgi:hypothetical protein
VARTQFHVSAVNSASNGVLGKIFEPKRSENQGMENTKL